MLSFLPSLYYNGNCEEAFNFYKSIFGGHYAFIVRYDTPEFKDRNLTEEDKNKVFCILYQVGQFNIIGEDILGTEKTNPGKINNMAITIHPEAKEDADRLFNALSAGGSIKAPIADTGNDYIGTLTDKFGITWRVWWFKQNVPQKKEIKEENITGEQFVHKDISNSLFNDVNMSKSKFNFSNLEGAVFDRNMMPNSFFNRTGLNNTVFNCSSLENVTITNDTTIRNMKINNVLYDGLTIDGIEVQPLIEAEMDRLDPERVRLRIKNCFNPDEVMKVMKRLDEVRAEFYSWLRSTPHELLTAKPEGIERWSAIDHLRHLVGTEDGYLNQVILKNNKPRCRLGKLPHFMEGDPSNPVGSEPVEDLELILKTWNEIHTDTKSFLKTITPEILKKETDPVQKTTVAYIMQGLPSHDLLHIRLAEKAVKELEP